jgi:glutamyl-tRNA synthetase
MTIRTRFAPSPTGFLHIGSARTALFSWLYAKKHQGVFILRIEDTDLERSTEEAVTAIFEGLKWMEIDYDEGPFFQTKRMDRYQEVISQLLKEGKAYRCYCSKERLEKLREDQLANKQKPRYDGHCRNLGHRDESKPYVVRFKNPTSGSVSFEDQIRGVITFQNSELDDLIITRSDGTPTYNFTVVVDDWDMNITHVIRGDDHINNTPRQINILKALGAQLPIYAHVPMILGSDGKKLSKRHGAISVLQYQIDGYLPEALLNYLVRLGWSYGDQEIFSKSEMIEKFSLASISRSPAIFNGEKLLWLNQHYLKSLDPGVYVPQLAWQLDQLSVSYDTEKLPAVILALRERVKTLKEMADKSRYFFEEFTEYDEKAKKELTPDNLKILEHLNNQLKQISQWENENIHQCLVKVSEDLELKLGKVAQPLRAALMGTTTSPPIDVTVELLGKEKTLKRIARALKEWS